MSAPIELDLDALEAAADNATSATRGEPWRYSTHYFAVTTSQPGILEGSKMVADVCNGADVEKERIGTYIAAAQPAAVLELVRRLRIAEQMGEANLLKLNTAAGDTLVVAIEPERMGDAARGLAGSLPPGMQAIIVPKGLQLQVLDVEAMRAAGWVREPESKLVDEFRAEQWWVKELESAVSGGTVDQRRAIAVVHNLLRQIDLLGLNP